MVEPGDRRQAKHYNGSVASGCTEMSSCRRQRVSSPNLTIGICLLAGFFAHAPSAVGNSSTDGGVRPSVTMDDILQRQVRSIRSLGWFNAGHLVAEFVQPGSDQATVRLISMNGTIGAPLGKGRFSSVSPDGRMLIQRTDARWVIRDLETGKRTRIKESSFSEDAIGFSIYTTPVWSNDSRYAAFIERNKKTSVEETCKTFTKSDVPVIECGGKWPASLPRTSQITLYDRSSPEQQNRIVLTGSALKLFWAPKNVLYASRSALYSGDASTEIVRIQPASSEVEKIYHTGGRFQSMVPAVNPAGDLIALVLDVDNRTWDDFQSLLLIDSMNGKELRRLTRNLPIWGEDYVWSQNGDEIYARVRSGGLDQVFAIPLDGNPRPLTNGARRHYNVSLSPDGSLLGYLTENGYGRKDVRVLDLETGLEKTILVLDEPEKDFILGEWRHVRWESTDGVRPYGYLILPANFSPKKKYPMIVDVHGGGEGSRLMLDAPLTLGTSRGPLEWHAWAALGYIVFVPDYRSTGNYGPRVISARYLIGEIGAIKDIEDIVSGTRYVIDQGFVNPFRVAVLGHSAGGQRVYILLTRHCRLFSAAILNEAISPDPVSTFIELASGKNTGGYPAAAYRQQYGGELAEFPERYKTNYMLDAYRIGTPTLIMLGNEKFGGIYHMPNEVLYSILKQYKVPTKLIKFVQEGHVYARRESVKLAFEEIRYWLESHMADPQDGSKGCTRTPFAERR